MIYSLLAVLFFIAILGGMVVLVVGGMVLMLLGLFLIPYGIYTIFGNLLLGITYMLLGPFAFIVGAKLMLAAVIGFLAVGGAKPKKGNQL